MAYESVLYEKRQGIAYATVNRPEKLNALNRAVLVELRDCLDDTREDADVRAVILAGAGRSAFVAGADVSEIAECDAATGTQFSRRGQELMNFIEGLEKPVIAAVHGYALGGGCELAMACTLRVASETARFGLPEVKLGIIPGYGGTQRLARLVGKGHALEMILTGEPITAQEAYRIGLVNLVVPEDKLRTSAEGVARKIAANPASAVALAMRAVQHGLETTVSEGEFVEAALFGLCCATEDMKEGTRAFLEKRPPKFTGR